MGDVERILEIILRRLIYLESQWMNCSPNTIQFRVSEYQIYCGILRDVAESYKEMDIKPMVAGILIRLRDEGIGELVIHILDGVK